jgi:hypothetical protein
MVHGAKFFAIPAFRIYYILQRRYGMKITADIPQEIYKFLRGWIVERRLAGESITVSTLITDILSKWKMEFALVQVANGQQLRRRRGRALASGPIGGPTPDSQPAEATTVGQDIDKELEGLSQEECAILHEILVPQVRQYKRLIKMNRVG